MAARAGLSFDGGLEGRCIPMHGVRGDIAAGQIGKGLIGRSAGGGGVGSSPHLPCVQEESEMICRNVKGAAEGRGKDLVDAFQADELVSTLFV